MKRLLVIVLCVLLAFSAMGCVAQQPPAESSSASSPSVAPSESAAAPSAAAKDDLDPSLADADAIKLGVAVTMTGPQSSIGRESERGIDIALQKINSEGGIYGKMIKVIKYDDKGDPQASLQAVTRLIEQDNVNFIIGPLATNSFMAVGEYANSKQMPIMTVAVGIASTTQGWDYAFRCTSNTRVQCIQAADFIEKHGYKKVAILNINEEYGNNSNKDLKTFLNEKNIGIEYVAEEVYKNGDTDFTAQAVKIANAKPDILYIVAWANDLGAILKQIRQAGYKGPILGDNSFPGLPVREVAGDAANNCYCTAAYILPDTYEEIDGNPTFATGMMNEYLHKYYDTYKELPTNDNCYRSYDGLMIYKEAILKAKSLVGKDIANALSTLSGYEGLAGTFDYVGNNGEGIYTCKVYKLDGGKITEYKY